MVLDWSLLELLLLTDNYVVFSFEDEAISNEILFVKEVCFLHKVDAFFGINVVITLFDIHGDKVKFGTSLLTPFFSKSFVFLHDIVVIKYSESVKLRVHLSL
jgi:hypothetical protein